MPKDDEQDRRIADLETGQAVLNTRFDAFEKVSEERHTAVLGTTQNTKSAVDDLRKSIDEDRKARDEDRKAKEARELELAAVRWSILKEPRTQVLAAVLFLCVFAPQTLPLVFNFAAAYFGGKVAVEQTLDDAACCFPETKAAPVDDAEDATTGAPVVETGEPLFEAAPDAN